MRGRRRIRAAWPGALLALAVAGPAGAQGVLGTAQTSLHQVQLRPIVRETVPRSAVTERPDGAFEFDGVAVVCLTETECVFYRSAPVQTGVAFAQDVELTAWGFGISGLSASVLLRSRAHLGGEFVLPRSEDAFEAVVGYLELNRPEGRVRLGRQRALSGLGATSFDGLDLRVDLPRDARLEVFGGRSLAPGLSEPRHRALRALEEFAFLLDQEAYLLGWELGAEPRAGSSVSLRYQREIWADRSGLLSERAALTGRTVELRPVVLSGAAEYDFSRRQVGTAHLRAQRPVGTNRVLLEATARRYVPYFELWTIWGYFSPVGYDEAILQGSWQPLERVAVRAATGHRRYRESHAPIFLEPLRGRSWRSELGGRWRITDALVLDGAYTLEGPVGAFVSAGDAVLTFQPGDRLAFRARGSAWRHIEEFRVGQGTVVGAGAGLDARLWSAASAAAGIDLFRQRREGGIAVADWNQLRSWLSLQIGFGRDPGRAPGGEP
jgi:hypothetical protein